MIEQIIPLYISFATATAIQAVFTLLMPVLDSLKKEAPDSVVLDRKIITIVTFFILSLITAPLLFIPAVLTGSSTEIFRETLFESLKD